MKYTTITTSFLFLFPLLLWAQIHEFVIKDSISGIVIPDVNLQYSTLNEGTISNLDGKVQIIKRDTIILSHLSYKTKRIPYEQYATLNTLYLEPGEIALNEVVVSNFNLKQKLRTVLENYSQFYIVGEKNYQATFKESFRINDSLARLFQVKMEWWNADYELVFEESWTNQNHFQFIVTDYEKISGLEKDFQVSLKNSDFLKSLFLNHYLYFLVFESKEFLIHVVDKQEDVTRVAFSVPLEENGVIVRDCENCEIFFDNTSGAVLKLNTALIERSNEIFVNEELKLTEKNAARTTAFTREISFFPYGNKLRLNKLNVTISADVKVKDVITHVKHEESLYVTKVLDAAKISKSKRINLYKNSFYESIPKLMSNTPNILLTKEEINFVN